MNTQELARIEEEYSAADNDEAKLNALRKYDEAFQQWQDEQEDSEKALADAIQSENALKIEIDELEKELASQEASQEANKRDDQQSKTSIPNCSTYISFLDTRASILAEFQALEAALHGIAIGEGAKITGDWLGAASLSDEKWGQSEQKYEAQIVAVQAAAAKVNEQLKSPDVSLEAVVELWKSIEHLRPKAVSAATEASAKRNTTKDTRKELEAERARLLTWCRQQKTNLDGMVEPEHIQEFCSSLLANYPPMEENFRVLLEIAGPLLPDEQLQRDLLECNEVWLNLQVCAYERMRHTLLEIHPKSKLEDEVREFSSYSDRVGRLISEFSGLLSGPVDPESEQLVRPVMEECETLRLEFPMHKGLSKQLRDFALRMECLREGYSNLRRAVLSRLTFLTSAVPALTASMRRKEEYVARMKELKGWVEVKAQGETWKDIHERILAIKSLIEKEQVALQEAKDK